MYQNNRVLALGSARTERPGVPTGGDTEWQLCVGQHSTLSVAFSAISTIHSCPSRLESNSQGRQTVRVNAFGWGLKLDSQLSCTGIPEADTKCRFQMKGVASYLLAIAGRVRPATEYLAETAACGGASKGNASPYA